MPESLISTWQPEAPKLRPVRLLTAWLTSAVVLLVVAGVLRGVRIDGLPGALLVAAVIAGLNAIVPPRLAALRLPATLVLGSVLLILLNALMIQWAAEITDHAITVDNFGAALATAIATAAVTVAISVAFGSNDDDEYTFRVVRRITRRQGHVDESDVPGLLFLEIDGLSLLQGCAFEELNSFHGGLGGPQTRPFVLHPAELQPPDHPVIGCAALHEILAGWRAALQSN